MGPGQGLILKWKVPVHDASHGKLYYCCSVLNVTPYLRYLYSHCVRRSTWTSGKCMHALAKAPTGWVAGRGSR